VTVVDLRRIPDAWQRLPVIVRDLPLALVLALAPLLPSLREQGTQLGDLPDRPLDALGIAVVALESLPLAVRRRWPGACLALVSLGFAVDQLRGYHTVAAIALPVALLSAGAHLRRLRRTTAVLASLGYAGLAVALDRGGSSEGWSGFVTFYVLMALAWGIGSWMRQTRAAETELRLRTAEAALAAERSRLARELHDVVTHHVTAMVVQAEAARYVTSDPSRLDASLTAISDTGRRATSDLRHLLGVLQPDPSAAEPRTPTVGDVAELVEQSRAAGQPVEYVEQGTPPAAPGSAEAAAYRVVQEALTNALKHAHGRGTRVRVEHHEEEITVEVATDGPVAGAQRRSVAPAGSGRGLAGLRDRVELLGGELVAARRPDGAFVVRARIPAGSAT